MFTKYRNGTADEVFIVMIFYWSEMLGGESLLKFEGLAVLFRRRLSARRAVRSKG